MDGVPTGSAEGRSFDILAVRVDLDTDVLPQTALSLGRPRPPAMVGWVVYLVSFCQRSQPPWAAIAFSNKSVISSSSFGM